MQLVTLDEAKKRLSYESDEMDSDITLMVDSIESYLFFATGVDFANTKNDRAKGLAKDYVLTALYVQYYNVKDDILSQARLTAMVKQLQAVAAYEA